MKNKAYWNGKELRGPITMKKPDKESYWGRPYSTGMDSYDYGSYYRDVEKYDAHLASLPVIPSSGFEGMPVGEVEYEEGGYAIFYQGNWCSTTKLAYDQSKEDHRRIIYVPATPKASEQSLEDEILAAADKYGFRVPYDGTNNFYDDDAIKHFLAGVRWLQNKIKQNHQP